MAAENKTLPMTREQLINTIKEYVCNLKRLFDSNYDVAEELKWINSMSLRELRGLHQLIIS